MTVVLDGRTDPARAGNSPTMRGELARDSRITLAVRTDTRATTPDQATRAVYDAHADYVWRTLWRMGIRDGDREDAFQDVFLIVQRRIVGFRPDDPIKPWLFTICHNVVHHRRRSHERTKRRHARFEVDGPYATGIGHASPEEAAMAGEAFALVEAFLVGLDENRRWIFHLAEIEGLTAPEIAAALDVNLNTVYTRLRAARGAFATFVRTHGSPEVDRGTT